MKEMLTKIGWSMVRASEKAIERLPEKYIEVDKYSNKKEAFFDQCMDKKVIDLAKEMGFDFLDDDNYEGFRIISWEETEVMPMFFEGEYGDTELVFVTRKSAKSNEDFEHRFVGNDYDTDSFDWKYMQKILKNYEVVDYEPTEIVFTMEEKEEIEAKILKEKLRQEEEERKRKKEQMQKEILSIELPKDKWVQITVDFYMVAGYSKEEAILKVKEVYYHQKKAIEKGEQPMYIPFGNPWTSCHRCR